MAKAFQKRGDYFGAPPPTPADDAASGRRDRPVSVTELSVRIKRLLETGVGRVRVEGEISNMRRPASGHAYFCLKDADASINCVCFRSKLEAIRAPLNNGMKIEVTGAVTAYGARSEYQIIVDTAREAGLGDLMRRFIDLRDRLQAEGLFAAERKKPIPRYPRAVGLATSITGAAIRDMLHVLRRRAAGLRIFVAPCAVQGDAAPGEIVRAIRLLDRSGRCDVIIAARGGGSVEDLWAFNDERVVRAISACRTPVVSGVGHEIDTTLADFAADLRAPTPSAAAELVTANYEEVLERVGALDLALDRLMRRRMVEARARLAAAENSWGMRRPADRLAGATQRLDELHQRLDRAGARGVERARERLARGLDRLERFAWRPRVEPMRARLEQAARAMTRALARRLEAAGAELRGAARALDAASPVGRALRGRDSLARLTDRLNLARPDLRWAPRLAAPRERLAQLDGRAERAVAGRLEGARAALGAAMGRLNAVNPMAVLERGYSVVMTASGSKIITAPGQARSGQVVRVRSAGGEWKAQALPNVDELFDEL